MKNPNINTVSQLEELPNIGKAMAKSLHLVGINTPQELVGKNGYQLHRELCRLTGKTHDPCVIDVFLSVIDFMEGGAAAPWWKYTEARKKHL